MFQDAFVVFPGSGPTKYCADIGEGAPLLQLSSTISRYFWTRRNDFFLDNTGLVGYLFNSWSILGFSSIP